MDPYLEDPAFWPDFHDSFITYWRDALNAVLPGAYEARINERVELLDPQFERPLIVAPDVTVSASESWSEPGGGVAVATVVEPVTIPLVYLEETRETFLEIRRRSDRTVVTVLELLSPSNKGGGDRGVYLARRELLLRQDVTLVELDLLRAGQRVPLLREPPPGDYYYFVSRSNRRPLCDVYAWTVRHALPIVPVPLRVPEPDLSLNLGEVFATAYERGRYARSIDYASPPEGTFADNASGWVDERLAPLRRSLPPRPQ
jgi:hypothetical protein